MSMVGYLVAVSPRQMEALKADPDLAEELVNGLRDADMDEEEFDADEEATDIDEVFDFDEPVQESLCVEQAWDVLSYVVGGKADEAEFPAAFWFGGEPMGDDLGYGPGSLLDSQQTAELAQFLQGFTTDQLKARVNLEDMEKREVFFAIGIPEKHVESQTLFDIETHFPALRDYVAKAAAAQHGLLIWLC